MSSVKVNNTPGGGGGGLELTPEESAEFNDTLKSLETTMKRHMTALAGSKGGAPPPAANGQPAMLAPQPTAGLTPAAPAGGAPPRTLSRLRREGTRMNGATLPTRNDKVTIYVRIVFLKVGEIDTLRDRFAADAFIQSKWREPAMDGKLRLANEDINWEVYWNPKLSIENAFGEPKEQVWYSVNFDNNGLATVTERRRVNGSFLEYMELYQFPFDTQDLTVTLTTDRDENEIEFVEDPRERCALNVDSFVDEQEWKLHKYIHVWTKTREEAYKNAKNKHPCFSAATKASRRPEFFIWNILVVMFLICSLSFATFAVDKTLPQNRLQLSFILLLTTVSFKFVVNQSLPMIAYLTYLDKYILGSMGILCCICIWHAIVARMSQAGVSTATVDITQYCDYAALFILSSIYIGFHILFVILVTCLSKENRSESDSTRVSSENQNDDELEDNPWKPGTKANNSSSIQNRRDLHSLEDDYDENGILPELMSDAGDSKAIRNANLSDQATAQQTVMSAWQ